MTRAGRASSYLTVMQELNDGQSPPNPLFNMTIQRSRLQQLKRVCNGFTLLPVRILLTIVNAIFMVIVAKVATLGLREQDYDLMTGQPLAWWRIYLRAPLYVLVRFQLFILGFLRIRTRGVRAPRSEAPFIVANHVSGLVDGMLFWQFAKLAEAEFASNPALGPVMLCTESIFVDRSDPESRHKAKDALVRRAGDERFPHTLIFPEGSCTNGSALIQFKQGAFAPGVPVQPVVLRYPFQYHDPSFTIPQTVVTYLLGLMTQFVNYVEVEYLPVYVPNETEKQSPILFAAAVQARMAEALGVPTTKHAAEDTALCIAAQRMALPAEEGLMEWQALTEQLIHMSVNDAKAMMKRFRDFGADGKGRLDFEAFSKAMRAETVGEANVSEERLRAIFDIMDTSGDGFVNFKEYLCGVAVLNGHGRQEESATFKFVFDVLAKDQEAFTREQLDELLVKAMPTLTQEQLGDFFREADTNVDGRVSRDEFIAFATKYRKDLQLDSMKMLDAAALTMQ